MTGRLFLVVGPSGAGKDTLLDAAKEHFAGSEDVYFPQRYITRNENAGGEDHIAVDEYKFELLRLQAQFAFYWGAHDLKYGVPHTIDDYLNRGTNVVVNVSRGVIEFVREHYDDVTVISIKVSPDELELRLRARGRENDDDIAQRLERARAFNVVGPYVVEIDNSANLEQSVKAFIATISTPNDFERSA
ncbi:phosphonate metabolism protein/1,5-bisphosphokinase (PRPP-forming) PhnN [Terasakiella sp. A23]|uniref:phosphonate metabolism protein/1,5-bisphosphokinase (PRPP-forming) PhnN n=1 Tax=Terasakiella sp. FCG-A23 TaxID=3080561 RepID=UPI00295564F2|nr:phosphonate metabolism protein/1,5-bisphosphokinase (PRPP-forming) PhnN [Terasakiella sp. A23]MDV7340332.1 phosphonate metabolism protein/1,5-bisphosphokinase (PRPP-forming) PhnN [Terasakiella sp. A23]